jgi:hypothetical protein
MNRFSKAASVGGLFHLPRVLAAGLFAFNVFRLGNIFGGQFSQRCLRFDVTNIVGMPFTFGGLISQIDGA